LRCAALGSHRGEHERLREYLETVLPPALRPYLDTSASPPLNLARAAHRVAVRADLVRSATFITIDLEESASCSTSARGRHNKTQTSAG
jgi:hypothetical protein